jgi:hypothetical protein
MWMSDTMGHPLVSALELVTRHTHVLWQYAHQHGAKSRPGVVLPQKSSKVATMVDSENEVHLFSLLLSTFLTILDHTARSFLSLIYISFWMSGHRTTMISDCMHVYVAIITHVSNFTFRACFGSS